jgi:hypothetical protein
MGKSRIIHRAKPHHILCNFRAYDRKRLSLLPGSVCPGSLRLRTPACHTPQQNLLQPLSGGAETRQMRQRRLTQSRAVWRGRYGGWASQFTATGNSLAAGLSAQRARADHTSYPTAPLSVRQTLQHAESTRNPALLFISAHLRHMPHMQEF